MSNKMATNFLDIKDGDLHVVPQEQLAAPYAFIFMALIAMGLFIRYYGVIRWDRLKLWCIRHYNKRREYCQSCFHYISAIFTRNENDAGNDDVRRNRLYDLFDFLAWFWQRYRRTTETAGNVNDNDAMPGTDRTPTLAELLSSNV